MYRAITQEKESKCVQNQKKELNLFLFTDDLVLYIENPKEYTHTIRTNRGVQQGYRVQDWYTKIHCFPMQINERPKKLRKQSCLQ